MIEFKCSVEEYRLIAKIVKRAHADGLFDNVDQTPLDTNMDLSACHSNGCPLDLQKLLDADAFNFAHDVAGIRRHIDRETGELGDGFLPRCAAREPAMA